MIKQIVMSLKKHLFSLIPNTFLWKLYILKWKKINIHNYTLPVRYVPFELVGIGKGTYGNINVLSYYGNEKLLIGNYCSIGENVSFLLGVDHPLNKISTYPFEEKILKMKKNYSKGDIVLEDDVWVGYGCTILSGTHIGKGAVIAAGAVVTKDVPSYAVVGGVPARIIKYRFSSSVIKELSKIDFSNLKKEKIKQIRTLLNKDITDDNVSFIISELSNYDVLSSPK